MKLDIMPVAPLGANCIFVSDDENRVVIVDPGGDFDRIVRYIETYGYQPHLILCTHGHFDHVGAVEALREKYGVDVYIHREDEELMMEAPNSALYFGTEAFASPRPTAYYGDGDTLPFGEGIIEVRHTPGHTPGGVSLYIKELKAVITGDTLFREAIGRTDFPGGSLPVITESIQTKLYTLPDETVVYAGHDISTTIGHEKKHNPYVRV